MRVIKRSLAAEESFLEDFVQGDLPTGTIPKSILPPVNIRVVDRFFWIEVAAPGYEKRDLKTELKNGILTISARRKPEGQEVTGILKSEFQYAAFQRTFRLPVAVHENSLSKKYDKGILYISLMKI
jgi:HSP20 family protein